MSSTNLTSRIMLAIQTAVTKADLFTILDISEAVKADGGPFVRHREVHEIARPILDALVGSNTAIYSQYLFEDIDVNTKDGVKGARLYYPKHKDPNSYVARAKAASAPKVATKVVAPVATPVKMQAPKKGGPKLHVEVDYVRHDGSVEIPIKIINASGLSGKTVKIVNHPNSISIKFDPTSTRVLKQGFRISHNTLEDSNIDTHPIKFDAYTDTIVVTDSGANVTANTTGDKIIELFITRFGNTVRDIDGSTDLRNETKLDSLDYAEILMDIEDHFDIIRCFDNINLAKVRTINDIAASVDKAIAAK